MKTKQTPEMKKFEGFLQNVNRIKRNPPVPLLDAAEMENLMLTNMSFTEAVWNSPNDLDPENKRVLDLLQIAIDRTGPEDQTLLCQFLFQKDSVSELTIGSEHPDDLWNDLRHAADSYSKFIDNFAALNYVMGRLQSQRDNGTLPRSKSRRSVFGMKRSVFISIDANQTIYQRPEPLFYGFSDFARVKFCKQCNDYFLAKRADAEYCSENCGSAFRQKIYQLNHADQLRKKRDNYHKNRETILSDRKAISEKKKERPNIGRKK